MPSPTPGESPGAGAATGSPDPSRPSAAGRSVEAAQAFGIPAEKWYMRRSRKPRSPYARPLAVATGLIFLIAGTAVHGVLPSVLLNVAVVGLPAWALERWWRTRRRREEETLIPGRKA